MRYGKSLGGLSGGKLRTKSSKKLWLLTLASFTLIHQSLEEKQHSDQNDNTGHTYLQKSRMLDDFDKVVKLVEWFKSTELVGADPQQLVSFSTGEISTDDKVNCNMASAVGMQMQKSLDIQTFTSKVSLKSKCLNFNVLGKQLRSTKNMLY